MAKLILAFTSIAKLRTWLDNRRWEFDGPEAFNDWLQNFFEQGNTVTVHGEEYDYWACWELE